MANGRPTWKRRRHRLATKPVPPRPVPRLYLATPEVDDPSSLVASLPGLLARADVAHLTGIEALKQALPTLKPDRIAGIGGLATRHDSMTAAEAGADYVLFGEPDARGERPSIVAIAERLQWWAELFEPPCVGFAASREEVFEFAAVGADFVLVGDLIWDDARGAAAALMDAEQAIRQGYAAMPVKAKAEQG